MQIHLYVVGLWAEDVPALAHFYHEVVGLTILQHHPGERPHFDLGGCYLTILKGRPALPPEAEPRFPQVTFSVPDLDASIEKLRRHAVELPWGVEQNTLSRWVMFRDPAGYLVELVELDRPAAS